MKRTPLLTAVAVASLLVAACGDDDDITSDTTTSGEVTTPEETTSTPTEDEEFELFLLPAEAGDDCTEVISVRRAPAAGGGPEEALDLLLAGPTEDEESEDLRSWFSAETAGMLNSVEVTDGTAEVDFQDFSAIIPNASSSCGSASLLAQLDNTVLQFPDVDEVVYSFDGDRDAFYEWLQLSAPE